MTGIGVVCAVLALPLNLLAVLWRFLSRLGGSPEDLHRSDGAGALGNGLLALAWACFHVYWLAGLCALAAAMFARDWWRKRKRRKRAPRAYGAKSRALIAALVRKTREAAQPRPVLRPQPGGAG